MTCLGLEDVHVRDCSTRKATDAQYAAARWRAGSRRAFATRDWRFGLLIEPNSHRTRRNGSRFPDDLTLSGGVSMGSKQTQTVRRDSGSGRFITKQQAERRDPRTWEKQHIPKPGK